MVRKKECDGSQAWWSEKRKRSLQYICCRRQGESETTHAHREETDLFTHCRVLASSPTTAYSTIDCTGHDGLAGSFFLLSPQWGWMEANGSLRKQRAHSGRLTHVSTVMVLNAPTSHTPPPGLCVEQINPHLDQILTKSRRGSQARGSYIHTCRTGTNLQLSYLWVSDKYMGSLRWNTKVPPAPLDAQRSLRKSESAAQMGDGTSPANLDYSLRQLTTRRTQSGPTFLHHFQELGAA